MRIGILTFHRSHNCGAMLQAWALRTVLEKRGHVVEFPDCGYPCSLPRWKVLGVKFCNPLQFLRRIASALICDALSLGLEDLSRYRYRTFVRKFLRERKCKEREFSRYYDLVVCGSDQIWNIGIACQRAALFLGETIPASVRMISYAASCGDRGLDGQDGSRIIKGLRRFERVSVRERLLQEQLRERNCKEPVVSLDPSLLINAAEYSRIAHGFSFLRPYLYVYTLGASEFVIKFSRIVAKKLSLDLIITPVYQGTLFRAPRGLTYGVSPERMLGYIQGASYVLAASFHGTALSIVHHKQFLSLRERVDETESRSASLLNQLGIGNRIVNPKTDFGVALRYLTEPIPESAYSRLESLRQESLRYIDESLEG